MPLECRTDQNQILSWWNKGPPFTHLSTYSGMWLFSYTCKCIAGHSENDSSQVQVFDFDQSYIPVAHTDYLRTKIAIVAMHRLTVSVLDFSNDFHDTNAPFSWNSLCQSITLLSRLVWKILPQCSSPYRLCSIFIQCINRIKGRKPSRWKWNELLDTVADFWNVTKLQLIVPS